MGRGLGLSVPQRHQMRSSMVTSPQAPHGNRHALAARPEGISFGQSPISGLTPGPLPCRVGQRRP